MHVKDLVGGEQCLRQALDVGCFSVSTAGDNEVPGRVQLAVNANLSRILKAGVAFEDLDAVGFISCMGFLLDRENALESMAELFASIAVDAAAVSADFVVFGSEFGAAVKSSD